MNDEAIKSKGADTALRVEQLLKELIECLSLETQALKENNRESSAQFLETKKRLLDRYQGLFEDLLKDNTQLSMLDDNVKSYLKTTAQSFEVALKDNIVAIRSGQSAINRLINRILKKARDTVAQENSHYNAKGEIVEKKSKGVIVPTRLNETY